jgi:hypothetical protein
MSASVALSIQELSTQGWTVVPGNLSPRVVAFIERHGGERARLIQVTRQAFDGLPLRITQALAGETILSAFGIGTAEGWHRGRSDTLESGAPTEFIPGFDCFAPAGAEPCRVEVIPGGGRLRRDDPLPLVTARTVELAPGDLLILDSRAPRHWPPEPPRHLFWFSIVRSWMTPQSRFDDLLDEDVPPRALRFYGVPFAPHRDVGAWIFDTHQPQSRAEAAP